MSKLELSITKLEDVSLRVQPEGYILTLRLKVLAMQVGPLWPWMDLQKAGALKLTLESAQLPLPLQKETEKGVVLDGERYEAALKPVPAEPAPAPANSSKPQRGRNPKSAGDLCHVFQNGSRSACGSYALADMADVVPYSGADDLYNPICKRCLAAMSKAEKAKKVEA